MDTSKKFSNKVYLSLIFEANPIDPERKEDQYIKMEILPLEVLYNPTAIKRLTNFIDINTKDQALKDAARENYEKAKEKSKVKIADAA